MKLILLNGNNLVSTPNKNKYRYYFPSGQYRFNKGDRVGLQSLIIPYSWYNITSTFNNNKFQYTWWNGITYDVNIPNSYMNVNDLNSYLQYTFIQNGHYLVDNNGNYVYYLTLTYNTTRYAVQVTSYPLPSSLPSGWTNPNSISLPSVGVGSTPKLVISSSNSFGDIIGFTSGSYPSTFNTTTQIFISNKTPNGSPVNSVTILCNICSNLSIPTTQLYSFTSSNTSFGSNIQVQPSQLSLIDITDSSYPYVEVSFVDDEFNDLVINDSNLTIVLVVKSSSEN